MSIAHSRFGFTSLLPSHIYPTSVELTDVREESRIHLIDIFIQVP